MPSIQCRRHYVACCHAQHYTPCPTSWGTDIYVFGLFAQWDLTCCIMRVTETPVNSFTQSRVERRSRDLRRCSPCTRVISAPELHINTDRVLTRVRACLHVVSRFRMPLFGCCSFLARPHRTFSGSCSGCTVAALKLQLTGVNRWGLYCSPLSTTSAQ